MKMDDLTPEESALIEYHRRSKERSGQWWLTEEGREYAKDTWEEGCGDPPRVYLEKVEELETERDRLLAKNKELLAALGAVEWLPWTQGYNGEPTLCPWCKETIATGHAPDCKRQRAMGREP